MISRTLLYVLGSAGHCCMYYDQQDIVSGFWMIYVSLNGLIHVPVQHKQQLTNKKRFSCISKK